MSDIRLKKITIQSNQSPLIIQKGDVVISNTTISNSVFQGALVVNGGISVNTTFNATSSTAGGGLTVGGGLGVIKNVYIGNDLVLDSSNSVFKINGLSDNRLLLDVGSFSLSPDGVNKRFYLTDTSLSVNLTTGSVNSSTGAFYVAGGISVNSIERANSSSNGGALTVAGGVAVGENINVNKEVILGELNSNNSGLTIRYTGLDQILLMDSTGHGYSSLNMNNNNLFISNDSNINIHTSNGVVNVLNGNSILLSVKSDHTDFSKRITITDTTQSIDPNTASVLLSGGMSITATMDASASSVGGSFTTLGGMAIAKRIFTGDSIGIDISNHNKKNKLVLYQDNYDISQTHNFTGFGNTNNNSIVYQVSNTSGDHIFYAGDNAVSSNEIFKIRGNNDVVFNGRSQGYTFIGGGNNDYALSIQSNLNSKDSSLQFFTKAGDGSDKNNVCIFGVGAPNNTVDSEYMSMGWGSDKYIISTNSSGVGVTKNLVLQTGYDDQIVLKTDGSTLISSNIKSTSSTVGALILSNGGLSINSTDNSTSITSGGAMTVAGGCSIFKNMFLGGSLKFQDIELQSTTTNSSYSSLKISGMLNPEVRIASDINNTQYPFNFTLFSLGESDENSNCEFLKIANKDNDGYSIYSDNKGSGNLRFVKLFTGNNNTQLVLQTSGNVGINTSNPNYKFDINGTLGCNDIVYFTNTQSSESVSNGSLLVFGGVSIQCTENVSSETQGGSLSIAGGVGIAKGLKVGGVSTFTDETPSTSSLEASVVIKGGLSVHGVNASNVGNGGGLTVDGGGSFGGDLYVGGSINGSGSSSTTFAYLTITATDEAINLSTGSILTFGGITVQSDRNSANVSNGGSILTSGGASIGKDLYIGCDNYIYGVTNYSSNSDNVINFYDNVNIKRFSIDKSQVTHDFSISRYDTLGNPVEKVLAISNLDGTIVFNNTTNSSSDTSAAIIVKGGLTLVNTTPATSLQNGGCISISGGVSISKNMLIGGDVVFLSTTPSINTSTGSLLVAGGVGVSGDLNVLGNTLIVGNLTVNGQTTSIQTTNTVIKDNVFVLNSGPSGSTDAGFVIQRYQDDNNSGTGDVINDDESASFTLPDQSGMTNVQLKLNINASAINDYYKGWWVKVGSGFSNNQSRMISSYNGTTKIAVVSSPWFNQNPSIGDSIYLYNKPYVGLVFNETSNVFEFGSTTNNPGDLNISFSDYLPIHFSSAKSLSTVNSTSGTGGSFVMSGGISISNTSDSTSVSSGGTFTTLGGGSFGKTLRVGDSLYVNGVNTTPNPYDIYPTTSFNINNNTSSLTDISGLTFDPNVWGFDLYLAARIIAVNNLYVNFHIRGVNKGGSWEIIKTYVGDDTGIEFEITNSGKLQYTTPNYSNFTSGTFKWRAFVN
jgi:hypothetical protein